MVRDHLLILGVNLFLHAFKHVFISFTQNLIRLRIEKYQFIDFCTKTLARLILGGVYSLISLVSYPNEFIDLGATLVRKS